MPLGSRCVSCGNLRRDCSRNPVVPRVSRCSVHSLIALLALRGVSRLTRNSGCSRAESVTRLAVADSSAIRSDAQQTLSRQAQWLNKYSNYRIVVEGHADERGTREYNLALGARRAAATRDYLISRGVAGNRLKTISYGKERPVAVCDDISCWSQNRRAVTTLSGAGS